MDSILPCTIAMRKSFENAGRHIRCCDIEMIRLNSLITSISSTNSKMLGKLWATGECV